MGCACRVWNPSRGQEISICSCPHTVQSVQSCQIQGCQIWSTGSQPQAVLDHNELKQRNVTWLMSTYYSHQYLITIQIFQCSQTHTTLGKQQADIFMFDSLLCSTIRCHQAPQQLFGILVSNSTMELWECFCHVPLESASRSVNNYSKPFFWLCCDFCVPFKKNKRLSSKQNKSALPPQLTALCMELKQNYKTETEKSTVLILASFYCICREKLDFWGWLPRLFQEASGLHLTLTEVGSRSLQREQLAKLSIPWQSRQPGLSPRQPTLAMQEPQEARLFAGAEHRSHGRQQSLSWTALPWPSPHASCTYLSLPVAKVAQPQPGHILSPSSWWQPCTAPRETVMGLKGEDVWALWPLTSVWQVGVWIWLWFSLRPVCSKIRCI